MPHKFIEGVTTADLCFQANGKTASELFRESALAVFEAMADPTKVKPKQEFSVHIKNEGNIEKTLFSFLEEIVYLKDSEGVVFHDVKVDVNSQGTVNATLFGDKVDYKTQDLGQDVKAITLHYYKVEKTQDGYKTQVVIDI